MQRRQLSRNNTLKYAMASIYPFFSRITYPNILSFCRPTCDRLNTYVKGMNTKDTNFEDDEDDVTVIMVVLMMMMMMMMMVVVVVVVVMSMIIFFANSWL